MDTILRRFLQCEIGINYLKPYHVDPAELIAAEKGYFAIRSFEDGAVYYYPYTNIIRIIEREEGVSIGGLFKQPKVYSVVVKVGHLIDMAPLT